MKSNEIIHSAYHISLEEEIRRILTNLKNIGIKNPTKIEASALIAFKNQKARMNQRDVFGFISKMRGLK